MKSLNRSIVFWIIGIDSFGNIQAFIYRIRFRIELGKIFIKKRDLYRSLMLIKYDYGNTAHVMLKRFPTVAAGSQYIVVRLLVGLNI